MNWILTDLPWGAWGLVPEGLDGPSIGPEYRGAFEAGGEEPRVLGSSAWRSGGVAAYRLRSRRRSFGVSVCVPPDRWDYRGIHRGWHLFGSGPALVALWTSRPATWLAQDAGGRPLPPPWSELWTFGRDHLWVCRIGGAGLLDRLDSQQAVSAPRRRIRRARRRRIRPTDLRRSA